MYFAPALVAASKDFFSRKLSSPKFDDQILPPQFPGQTRGLGIHPCHGSDIRIGLAHDALIRRLFLQRHHQPVLANGEADSGRRWASQSLRQSVITSAAQNCILRPQRAVREFKCRARVVIQPPNQAVVQSEWNSHLRQDGLHRRKMLRGSPRREIG